MKKLPIGIQTLREIIEEGQVYVDKTGYVLALIRQGKHYFMSRPRRFGKSLFVNTLEEIFRGNRELFHGLTIYESDYEWEKFPVLHFDFAQILTDQPHHFEESLKRVLRGMAEENSLEIETPSSQEGLVNLVKALSETNRVVVLVDEYDSSIINNLKHPEIAEKNRDILKAFFGALKSLDRYLKFTFVTGVSKFSQVSLFSGPNNLKDITMDPRFAGMMGYTEDELKHFFADHIQSMRQGNGATEEQILTELRTWYDGYRFSRAELFVYNPFSTLNYLDQKEAKTYWYSTGTPSFLIDELNKRSESMVSLDGATATEEELMDISRLDQIDLNALMYQTGYFTIKDYNRVSKRYRLGLPNEEVRTAFINSLVKNFTDIAKIQSSEELVSSLDNQDPRYLFQQIATGFSSFAYQLFVDAKEVTYQGMLLSMLYGMGFNPLSERMTNTGRIDVVIEVPKAIYILELKLNSSAEKALRQIEEKGYFKPYLYKGKKIVLIGANFSSETKNISEWSGIVLSETGDLLRRIF